MDKIDAMNLKSKKLLQKYFKKSLKCLTNKDDNMEAPKEIYLRESMFGLAPEWAKEPIGISFTHSDIKYIRADLAELTVEKIKRIVKIMEVMDDEKENCTMFPAPWYCDSNAYYDEVLTRYNNED